MKKRVSAIIVEDDSILLIKRTKPTEEYYTFPGGEVEIGESLASAMQREIKEELGVRASVGNPIFFLKNKDREDYYFLVKETLGVPKLGGPELDRMSSDNQYNIEFINIRNLKNIQIYPDMGGAKSKIVELFAKTK